jgi:hypothetical protein
LWIVALSNCLTYFLEKTEDSYSTPRVNESSESSLQEENSYNVKDMFNGFKDLLSLYSRQLAAHEGGVERRLQVEIRRREEAERKLEEKLEEIRIL